MNDPRRHGAVLVIVTGMTCMLIALALTFLARIRSDGQEMRQIVQEAQARLMLHAGLMYLQEGSRIGWGPDTRIAGKLVGGGECFGWTDVRDGSLGPKGPRPASVGPQREAIPPPTWWKSSWPTYTPLPDDGQLPAAAERVWPCPGAAMRCAMGVAERPPYAIAPLVATTPVTPPADYADPVAWQADWGPNGDWPGSWKTRIYDSSALGMLDPQPVAGDWESFRSGKRAVDGRLLMVPSSENLAWFRVYRELLADHDNDPAGRSVAYGAPGGMAGSSDRVALYDPANPTFKNWNVFIVACGAGATRGYRFWDLPDSDPRRAIEPVTARESGIWEDSAEGRKLFDFLRREQRVLWFRVEWSGQESGGLGGNYRNLEENVALNWRGEWGGQGRTLRELSPKIHGGGFKWIQRLASEPANW